MSTNMLEQVLKQAGMSKKQAKIYLAAIALGETTIKEIAQKSGIRRTTIYDVIQEMIDLGYIKLTSHGARRKFLAATPEELQFIIKRRVIAIQGGLEDLIKISNVEKSKPKVWFFEGIEGLKNAFNDTLKYPEKEIYQWGSRDILDVLGEEWSTKYMLRRAGEKIFAKTLSPDFTDVRRYKKMDAKHYREIRLVDPKEFPLEIELDVYGNRLAMISVKDQMAVIIESKPIANTLKVIHKMCWEATQEKNKKDNGDD